MIFKPTPLADAYIVEPQPFQDDRGWFVRTYCKKEFQSIGFDKEWVQLNHSYNLEKGTLRGMHFQKPPFSEAKLVRCIAGEIYDVIIDLRLDSPTFLSWFGVKLSAKNKIMLFIPEGFAHGFQTLKKHTELIYHHSTFYAPEAEFGLRYDDPNLNINWPLAISNISNKDAKYPLLDAKFKGLPIL